MGEIQGARDTTTLAYFPIRSERRDPDRVRVEMFKLGSSGVSVRGSSRRIEKFDELACTRQFSRATEVQEDR